MPRIPVLFLMFLSATANAKKPKRLSEGVQLSEGYKKYLMPRANMNVAISFQPLYISSLDDQMLTVTVVTTVRMRWEEPRMRVSVENKSENQAIDIGRLKEIWMPDLMVKHLETLERLSVLTPVEALNATRDGYFSYQFQARITVACPNMDFKDFPMDRQSCDFCFTTMNQRATGAFTFNSRLDGGLWSQRLKEFKADVEPLPAGEAGFRVVVTRQFEVHMLRYYLPCVAIVKVSLVSFIIDPHVVPGRAGLLVTLFLVTFTIFGNIQLYTPKSRGLTALSIYVLACLLFVFAAIIEYAFILANLRRHKVGKELLHPKKKLRSGGKVAISGKVDNHVDQFCYRVDKVALGIFFFVFFFFNLFYMFVYTATNQARST